MRPREAQVRGSPAVRDLAPLSRFRRGEARGGGTSPPATRGSDGERSRQAAWGHVSGLAVGLRLLVTFQGLPREATPTASHTPALESPRV